MSIINLHILLQQYGHSAWLLFFGLYQDWEAKMLNFLKSFFASDPKRELEKEISKLYEQSVQLQRNGDLRTYGKVMAEIQRLEKEHDAIVGVEE